MSDFAVNVVMDRHPDTIGTALPKLFDWVQTEQLTPTLGPFFPLKEAAQAHAAISERKTADKVILQVSEY